VTLLNMVDGCLPSDMATGNDAEIEEERRLLYVAMTRARDHLDLMVPQRFHVGAQSGLGDRHVYASRTRFVPAALLALFEQRAWPAPPPLAAIEPAVPRRAPIDLAAQMRAMWN
jgi:DNA helicase-2/ATP-dependent DNA helicase PcrA